MHVFSSTEKTKCISQWSNISLVVARRYHVVSPNCVIIYPGDGQSTIQRQAIYSNIYLTSITFV